MTQCQVCTGTILKFSRRYGGVCCNACAAFFYRSINLEQKYNCTGTNECLKVASKLGKGCKRCRFDKCLAIGMSTPATLSNSWREEKKLKKDCTVFATILNSMLTLSFETPELLKLYLQEASGELMTKAFDTLKDADLDETPESKIQPLIYLLTKHPIKHDEFPYFSLFCLCKLDYKALIPLSSADEFMIKALQAFSLQKLCLQQFSQERIAEMLNITQHLLNTFYAMNFKEFH